MNIKWFFIVCLLAISIVPSSILFSFENNKSFVRDYYCIEKHSVLQADSKQWELQSSKRTHYIFLQAKPLNTKLKQIINEDKLNLFNKNSNLKPNCYLNEKSELIINFNGFEARNLLLYDFIGNTVWIEQIQIISKQISINVDKIVADCLLYHI